MKKFLAMLLAMIMVISLAACGSKPAETPAPAETQAPAAEAPAEAPAETEAPAPALDPVTLKIWFHGSNVQPEASEKVMAELNAYLAEKINVTLEPIWGTWGDFDTNSVLALQGGDDCDMYFTCNWSANQYDQYARDGYYVKLDDMLDTYAPELKAAVPQGLWDGAVVNGPEGLGIYGVPGLKDTATQNTWDVNGTLLAELGYDVDAVCSGKLDYYSDDFEAMLAKAKEVKGADFYPLLIEPAVLERMVNHTSIITGDNADNVLSYYYDAEHPSKDIGSEIVNKFATEEFAKFAARTYDFAQKGYISPSCQNPATANDYRTATQLEGAYLFGTQSYSYGYEVETSAARKIDVHYVPETAAYMDCTSSQGAMVAISTASKNPERSLMFLNLLNTDPKVMTMLNYGLEGFTYTDNGDGTITFIDENRANYSPWRNGMGNIRILPPEAAAGVNYWTDFAAYYDAAEALPLGGFIFDSSAFETQKAGMANAFGQYAFGLMSGAVDPATELPKFLDALDQAGIADFVAAANEQMHAYVG